MAVAFVAGIILVQITSVNCQTVISYYQGINVTKLVNYLFRNSEWFCSAEVHQLVPATESTIVVNRQDPFDTFLQRPASIRSEKWENERKMIIINGPACWVGSFSETLMVSSCNRATELFGGSSTVTYTGHSSRRTGLINHCLCLHCMTLEFSMCLTPCDNNKHWLLMPLHRRHSSPLSLNRWPTNHWPVNFLWRDHLEWLVLTDLWGFINLSTVKGPRPFLLPVIQSRVNKSPLSEGWFRLCTCLQENSPLWPSMWCWKLLCDSYGCAKMT